MIVRLMSEGQFRVEGGDLDKLNEVDNQIVEAIGDGDEVRFAALMQQMHDFIHKHGKRVPVDELIESDIILPAPDSTIDEVRELFAGEGMIPG